jgi:hypothetical protein
MRVVEIRHRRPDGAVEILARISAPEAQGPIVVEPTEHANLEMIEDILHRAGAVDGAGRPIPWSMGETFVRLLPGSLRGSRLWAEEVTEGEP